MKLSNQTSVLSAQRLAIAIEEHINNVSPMHIGSLEFKAESLSEEVLRTMATKLNDSTVEFINRNNEWLIITTYHSLELLEAELLTPGYKMLANINVTKVHKESLRIGVRLDQASGEGFKKIYEAAKAYV